MSNFNDVKLLLPASGYMKTSDDGGRTVIDEIRDASYERNHQTFAGSDRPEFTDYNGVPSVDVEKESTNHIPRSNTLSHTTVRSSRGDLEVNMGVEGYLYSSTDDSPVIFEKTDITELGWYNGSYRVDAKNSDYFKVHIMVGGVANNGVQAIFTPSTGVWTNLNINTNYASDIKVFADNLGGNIWEISVSGNFTDTGVGVGSLVYFENGSIDVWIGGNQLEESAYPTNYIPTQGTAVTRLAPSPVIQNALPETGTIAGVVDMIRTGENQAIHWTGVGGSGNRSLFQLVNNNSFGFEVYGGGFVSENNPIQSTINKRFNFSYIITFSETNLSMILIDNSGVIYKYSYIYTLIDKTIKQLTLGRRSDSESDTQYSSIRFEKPLHKDNIVRVNATDAEIKAFFEDLTRGTSMELTADQMTIAP